MKLYEATAQLEVVNGWIEEHADEILANGGELTPELSTLLDLAEGDFKTKVQAVALKVRELQAEAEAVKIEAARLSQRAKTASNAAESLKGYLHRHLEAAGETTVKGTLVTVAIQKNPPAVELGDTADAALAGEPFAVLIPARFEWDKAAIKAAAKAGTPLPNGVHVTQGTSLRIR